MKSIAIVIGILALIGCAAPAGAISFLIEPELGVKNFTGDAKDLVGAGVEVGGTLGLRVTPQLVLVGRGDLGFHPAEEFSFADSVLSDVIDSGVSLAMAGGARFMPMAGNGQVQPYLGAQIGFSVLAWSYKESAQPALEQFVYGKSVDSDGLASLTFGGELGVIYMVNPNFGLSAGGRLVLHAWSSETSEGLRSDDFKGNELGIHVGAVLEFGQ